METNEKTANAAMTKALIKVQQHVLTAKKDGKNPMFNSRYATLDSVLDAIREPLSANGFALVQEATTGDMTVSVVTRLLHDSGGELASPALSAPLRKEFSKAGVELPPSVQQIGSVVTYLRRYSLCPFLGVAAEDDDDGNGASDSGKNAPAADKPHTAEKSKAAPAAAHRSIHTGELLDSPEAIERHKAAAAKATAAAEPKKSDPAPPSKKAEASAVNPKLAAAMLESRVTPEGLTGYLKGELGQPRISKPLLVGAMTADSLGEKIVDALLAPKNWGMVVERIFADPTYLPF
jgi:hypothetical protein